MRTINLYKSSGLPVFLVNRHKLEFKGLTIAKKHSFDLKSIRPQLLNENVSSPRIFYELFEKVDLDSIYEKKGIQINVLSVFADIVGIEFIKTHGRQILNKPIVIDVAYGSGLVIVQHQDLPFAYVGRIVKGRKMIIPPGFFYNLVNTGEKQLVVIEVMSKDVQTKNFYLDEMRGMSYYVIRKNGKYEIVKNPKYRNINAYKKIPWEKLLSHRNINPSLPILKQILRKHDNHRWLFEKYNEEDCSNIFRS